MSKGYGSMQTRIMRELLSVRCLDADAWIPVTNLVGPSRSEQESARRAVHRLAQEGRVEVRHSLRAGTPRRLVLVARFRPY